MKLSWKLHCNTQSSPRSINDVIRMLKQERRYISQELLDTLVKGIHNRCKYASQSGMNIHRIKISFTCAINVFCAFSFLCANGEMHYVLYFYHSLKIIANMRDYLSTSLLRLSVHYEEKNLTPSFHTKKFNSKMSVLFLWTSVY